MKVHFLCFLFALVLFTSCSQNREIVLQSLPANTPAGDKVYVSGTFNNWNPADPLFEMEYDAGTQTYRLVLSSEIKEGSYRYTRGDAKKVESDACGNETPIRKLTGGDLQVDTVVGWADQEHPDCKQITFIIQSNDQPLKKGEKLFLITAAMGASQSALLPFTFQRNGTYTLSTHRRPGEPFLFNVLRNKVSQLAQETVAPTTSDTVVLTIASFAGVPKVKADEAAGSQQKTNATAIAEPRVSENLMVIEQPQPRLMVTPPVVVSQPETDVKPTAPSAAPKTPSSPVVQEQKKPQEAEAEQPNNDTRRKVFVIIDKLPSYKKEEPVYLAGDFNNWDISNPDYQFKTLPNGKRYLVLRMNDYKEHSFKVTRGDDGINEANYKEEPVDLHEIEKGSADDTIRIKIDSWVDAYARKKLVIYLIDVPDNTPESDPIYLTGNFNNWKTDDELYQFKALGDNEYALMIEDFGKPYASYKITRGTMETEAVAANGRVPKPQAFEFIRRDTIRLRIERWKDKK